MNTGLLPSNRLAKLLGIVFVNAAQACTLSTQLRVDNVAPHFVLLQQTAEGTNVRLALRASEAARLSVLAKGRILRTRSLKARQLITFTLPTGLGADKLVLVDRAGNQTARRLH